MSFFIIWPLVLVALWIIVTPCRCTSIGQVTKLVHMKTVLAVRFQSLNWHWDNSWACFRCLSQRNSSTYGRIIWHQLANCIFCNWNWRGILTYRFVDDFIFRILINPTNFYEIIFAIIRFEIIANFTGTSSFIREKDSLYISLITFEIYKK